MSSQSGTAVATPQVFVNKAAKKIVIERKGGGGREVGLSNRRDYSGENSTPTVSKTGSNNQSTISGSVDDELEEGEIDADVPTTYLAGSPAEVASSKPRGSVGVSLTENVASVPPSASSATNGEQTSVQRKLTALERLKSLNFATSKSAVNPFTLVAPKPPSTTPADYKNGKKHSRQHSPSFQPAAPLPKKHRPPSQQVSKTVPYERQSRHGGRLNSEFDDGPSSSMAPFNRHYRQPSSVTKHRDFPFPASDFGPPPDLTWAPSGERCENLRHSGFDEIVLVESRFTPPIAERVPEVGSAANDFVQDEPVASTSSTVCWEKVRDLSISVGELNNASIGDLREVVQHLLDEEEELIQLHLRLQDQMKNVRRTLDREKQIEQLKKQALMAAIAARKAAKESEASDRSKLETKTSRLVVEDHKPVLGRADNEMDEVQSTSRVDIEDALKNSISEQAAARKAHLLQYVQAASGHRFDSAGAPFEYDPRHSHSSDVVEQSSAVPKEKFIAMLTSFFDGVASVNDRSLFQENATT